MSINFCHPAFQPVIQCDKVCVDGYDVTNLVSGRSGQSSSFLTESFIKPPVNVTVCFPCNVDVARIVLNSAHGAQRSCGFEIYSYCGKRKTSWLVDNVKYVDKGEFKIFSPIGRGGKEDESVFCFVNKRFKERHDVGPRMPSRLQPSSTFSEFTLAHHYPKHTSSVSELTIRISRVARSGVCAIRWLEIWGQPAYCCLPEVVTKIQVLKAGLVTPPPGPDFTPPVVSEKRTEDDENEFPPEFVDPITQELMSVPVLLPSGNSVDQSTVDRHIQEEAKWGRAPSDLFTGVVFSAAYKPVPNAGLKMRIDRFLLSGMAEGIHLTRRRLGGDRGSAGCAASRLVYSDSRQVGDIPTAEANNEVLTTDSGVAISGNSVSGGHSNIALISGNIGNGRQDIEDVTFKTTDEYDRCIDIPPSVDNVPPRKRIRRSHPQSTGRDIVTIDLTLDDNERHVETELVRLPTGERGSDEKGIQVRNRVRTPNQRGKGRKRTLRDPDIDGDATTSLDVARYVPSGTVICGESDVFRTSKSKEMLSTPPHSKITVASRLGGDVSNKTISTNRSNLLNTLTERKNARNCTTVGRQKASHEHDVDASLETALTSALRGLPTFSRRGHAVTDKVNDSGCCACGEDVKGTLMYQLQCAHVMCRHCLLNSAPSGGAVGCCICRRETPSSRVMRIH